MTDNDIRRILVERKREARKQERRQELYEGIGSALGFAGLFVICFMLSVIC